MSSKRVDSQEVEGENTEMRRGRYEHTEERVTRQTKMDFLWFDGTRVHDWIFRSERFFELDGTPPALKVSLASVYLLGLAMEWHYSFIKKGKWGNLFVGRSMRLE